MPKMKSHRGAAKRLKVTGGGKVVHYPTNKTHKNTHKSSSRIRRLRNSTVLSESFQKTMKEILPH